MKAKHGYQVPQIQTRGRAFIDALPFLFCQSNQIIYVVGADSCWRRPNSLSVFGAWSRLARLAETSIAIKLFGVWRHLLPRMNEHVDCISHEVYL